MYRHFFQRVTGPDGCVDFLDPSYVSQACEYLNVPAEIAEAFRAEAERIRGDAGRSQLAVSFHRELFIEKQPAKPVNDRLLAMGPESGMFAAVVYLGGLPQVMEVYDAKGIPEQVLIDTLGDMVIWMRHHRNKHGAWGLSQLHWLIRHWSGHLFKLGRLQFMNIAYDKPVKAFRHKATGRVLALADSGVRFRADGQVDGTNGVFDPEGGWTSHYAFDGKAHTGNPIGPDGSASRETAVLPADEWELVLQRGDPVLDVHIPEGEKMAHERCLDSYRRAVVFWADHFPEIRPKAFVCTSWLLSPQFRTLLPPDSNIVRFQRDYYVTPVLSDEEQTLERVFGFGTKLEHLPNVPRETSLQRIVYDYLASGGRIHGAAGFRLIGERETPET